MKMTILANYRSMLGLNKMDIRTTRTIDKRIFVNSVKNFLIDCDYAKYKYENLSITIALADVLGAASLFNV